ncbi:GNAT family N-acetyltransferase [bacterium]|jgi:GNAT superfamily N-acetyltransferase|nr:GNAT family N-acetyltransferase [bacterium]
MRTHELRVATVADAEGVANIVRGLGSEDVGLRGDFDVERAREWIKRLGESGTMVLALDGSIPVAFGALDFSTTEPETGILGVWVSPEYRRRGLATAIANELVDFARENGYRRIRGRLPEGNEPALSFLSAIGAMVPLRNANMTFELPL